jgi:hypothetical protein
MHVTYSSFSPSSLHVKLLLQFPNQWSDPISLDSDFLVALPKEQTNVYPLSFTWDHLATHDFGLISGGRFSLIVGLFPPIGDLPMPTLPIFTPRDTFESELRLPSRREFCLRLRIAANEKNIAREAHPSPAAAGGNPCAMSGCSVPPVAKPVIADEKGAFVAGSPGSSFCDGWVVAADFERRRLTGTRHPRR